jgi:hydrogenase nickel incorporation protein HypB
VDKIEIDVKTDLLRANDLIAQEIRETLKNREILLINLLSSPGAGKTSLIERLIDHLSDIELRVIEGDIETARDAERIRKRGIEAVQITTSGACHLEAHMVKQALHKLSLPQRGIIFVENVGNLVCPASYDLGEHIRIVILSTPEGDDKPKKYPKAFRTANVFVITKADLLPHLPFDVERARNEAFEINPELDFFLTSAVTGEGIEELAQYIKNSISGIREGD